MLKTILFDMDGVLIDSRESMRFSWDKVNTRFNLNIEFTDFLGRIGKPFENILAELGIPEDFHQPIKLEYGRCVSERTDLINIYRSVPYLIRSLKSLGIKIGVVTSKEYWRA